MPAPCSLSCIDRSISVNAQQAMNAVRFSNECESMDENSYTRAGYRALGHVARCALLVSLSPSPSHPRNSCAFKGDMWPKGEDVHLGIAQFRAHQVQCWSICLKTSLFPIAPSGTARLVSCWSHLAAFWDPFEVLVHGDGAGTCLGPVRYMYSIKSTVVDMWDCR